MSPEALSPPKTRFRAQNISTRKKGNVMRKTMVAIGLLSFVALTACNTARGVGRDVESVGKAVEKTVD